MKFRIALITVSLLVITNINAQIRGMGDFFGSGQQNAELLFKSYFAPWTNALGASLNGGWYNTAKTHQLGGFDLTITSSISIIPDIDKTFDVSSIGLSNVTFPEGPDAATIAGSKNGGIPLVYTPLANFPNQNVEINSPNGTGVGIMATPMAQLGIGLIKDTELDFRYMPKVSLMDYGTIGLWGIGLKHSIKQWIPVISKVPVFQLSVQGGFTKFNTSFNINVTPETYNMSGGSGNYEDQTIGLEVKSFTASLLVGANLPIVCFYGGLGFARTNANLSLNGNFPIPTVSGNEIVITDIENPIDVDITNSDGSKTKPRLNAGMRIKMGLLTLHGDYTYANYSVATVGIGISFR